jgi:hypothetical protein
VGGLEQDDFFSKCEISSSANAALRIRRFGRYGAGQLKT